MTAVGRAKMREILRLVAAGDLAAVDAEAWLPGYG